MKEKFEKKLRKILAKEGLDEEQVNKIVAEIDDAKAEEEAPDGNDPEDAPTIPSEEENGEGTPAPEEPAPEAPEAPEGEVPPAPEGEVPPNDGNIEAAISEIQSQEGEPTPEGEVPPVEVPEAPAQEVPPAPPAPAIDPAIIEELVNGRAEDKKTIEALMARVGSLEDALKSAGVIVGNPQVGDETPRITPNASAEGEDAFDDVIAHINGK